MTDLSVLPMTEGDLPELVRWTSSREFLLQWAGPVFTYPLTIDQLLEHFGGCQTAPPRRRMYKAVDCDGRMVGHAELDALDVAAATATVSRVIVGNPRERGTGLGTEIMRRIIAISFGELELQQLHLHVFDFNARALACYRKVGFSMESHIPDARRVGDSFWGLYRMVLQRNEAAP